MIYECNNILGVHLNGCFFDCSILICWVLMMPGKIDILGVCSVVLCLFLGVYDV